MKAGDISIDLTLDGKQFAVEVRNAGNLLGQLQQKLTQTAASTQTIEKRLGGLTTNLRSVTETIGTVRFALMDVNDIFLTLPQSILKVSGEFEKTTQLLKGLSKAADEGTRMKDAQDNLNYIVNLSKNAPFQIGALTDAFVKFKAGGLDPLDGSLQALVDGVAKFGGDSEVLKRASVAIQQMAGKGVISMEELRQQLGEAVPTAMKMMAEGLGMSMQELNKAVSNGQVQSTGALKRMFAVMSLDSKGAAKDMMETWEGVTSRLKTEWDLLQNDAGKSGFAAAMKEQAKSLTSALNSIQGRRLANDLGNTLGEIVTGLGNAVKVAYEFSDAINTVGMAFATYFVVDKVSSTLRNFITQTTAASKAEIDAYKDRVLKKQALDALQAEQESQVAAQEAAQNAERLANQRKYTYDLLAEKRSMVNQLRALEAEAALITANESRLSTVSWIKSAPSPELVTNSGQQAALKEAITANESFVAISRQTESSLKSQQTEFENSAKKAASLAAESAGAANKIGLINKAAIAGEWALTAMGGWFGALTIAVTLAALAFEKWGTSADEAIKKVRDAANKGLSDFKTVSQLRDDVTRNQGILPSQQKELDNAQDQLDRFNTRNANAARNADGTFQDNGLNAQLKSLQGNLAEWQGAVKTTSTLLKADLDSLDRAVKDAPKNAAQQAIGNWASDVDDQTKKIAASYIEQENKIRETSDKEIETINLTTKNKDDAAKKAAEKSKGATDQINALRKKQADDQVAYLKTVADDAKKAQDAALAAPQDDANEYQKNVAIAAGKVTQAQQRLNAAYAQQDAAKSIGNSDGVLTSGKNAKKPKVDPISRQIANAQGSLKEAMIRLDDLQDGVVTYERLYDSILAKLKEQRSGGGLRASDAQLEQEASAKAKTEAVNRMASSLNALNKIQLQINDDFAASAQAAASPYDTQETGAERLKKQLDKIAMTIPDVNGQLQQFKDKAAKLVPQQALNDLIDFGNGLKKQTHDWNISLLPTEDARSEAQFQDLLGQQAAAYDRIISQINATATSTEDAAKQKKQAEQEYLDWRTAAYNKHAEDMKTPLQKLTDEWNDSNKQVNDMVANWSKQSIDYLTTLMTTGKLDWRSMLSSMLTDLVRTNLERGLGEQINGVFGKLGDWIKQSLNWAYGKTPDTTQASSAASGIAGAAANGITDATKTASDSMQTFAVSTNDAIRAVDLGTVAQTTLTSATQLGKTAEAASTVTTQSATQSLLLAFTSLTTAAEAASAALASMAGSSGGSGIGSILQTIGGAAISALGGAAGGAGSGVAAVNGTATASGITANASQFMTWPHAKGGVMTALGDIPLQKYAVGGIARSPQFSIFGEGSKPEAYVPLPDGRSIPVTMQGNPGASVVNNQGVSINITINENGQASTSSSGKDNDGWNELSKRIGSMVQEQILKEKRPGGMLSK